MSTFRQRKAIELDWSDELDTIKGQDVSISANSPGWEEAMEIRTTKNDGYAVVTFPEDFTGESVVHINGSHGGATRIDVTVK